MLLIVLSFVLAASDYWWHVSSYLHSTLSFVVSPVRLLVDLPSRLLGQFGGEWASHQALLKENTALKAKTQLLEEKLLELSGSKHENKQLRELLSSSAQTRGEFISAEIMAVSSGQMRSTVIIDRGLHSGVYLGQPVIDAHGVYGQVVEVGPITSRVDLITDPQIAVPVQDARSGYRTILNGFGDGQRLQLLYVPDTADIRVGDVLFTSGLGLQYPKRYPVGTVLTVRSTPGERFTQILLKPEAKLHSTRLVLLVWPESSEQRQSAQKQLKRKAALAQSKVGQHE